MKAIEPTLMKHDRPQQEAELKLNDLNLVPPQLHAPPAIEEPPAPEQTIVRSLQAPISATANRFIGVTEQ